LLIINNTSVLVNRQIYLMYVYCQQYQIFNHKQLLISETSQRYRTFDKLQDFISFKRQQYLNSR
jgi:hypothetical protein